MPDFVVKQSDFEGPLDLLLTLIEKRKLHISDISLAKVTDDYISHVKNLGNVPHAEIAQFVLIASTLLLIKSRSLLPNLELTPEEERSIGDLADRLKAYEQIRLLSRHVAERFGKEISFGSNARKYEPVFAPDESMTILALLASLQNLLQALPQKEQLPKVVVKKIMSIEEMIDGLTKRIQTSLKMSFRDFAGVGKQERVHVIVGFLAMLELVKQGMISVNQQNHFEDIVIETNSVNTPNYSA